MSVEDSSGTFPQSDPIISAGMDIAMKWGAALGGPEKLKAAFEALEPQLKREHQIRLKQLEMQREAAERAAADTRAAVDRAAREAQEKRQHALWITGLYVSAIISVALLSGGIYIAKDVWWLAIMLCGPSLVAMGKLYVLRRSDTEDMRAVSLSARGATNAAAQDQPSPSPPM